MWKFVVGDINYCKLHFNMKLIQYIIILNFLFGTHYYIGDSMSIEDQNKEFDICYGYYPNETFKFADFNGNLNGGNYNAIRG